ncbi:MAG: (Fe-S)-binding protein [Anaerolineales bacterium]|nr:(Fe-S)-binding protein [Anaerolineales bacterium]
MQRRFGAARRASNEYLFNELATSNVEILNSVGAGFKPAPTLRIVTTCPHCLHTLKNEYPAFGGNYEVVHHTQLINELIGAGKLELSVTSDQPALPALPQGHPVKTSGRCRDDVAATVRAASIGGTPVRDGRPGSGDEESSVTFHDPCYLGRHNKIVDAPRHLLKEAKLDLTEMPRHAAKSFCCGAGGAQMWKEEEHGTQNINKARFAEAKATGAETLAVGCPFCLTMMNDAAKADGGNIQVKDVAEIVAERLKE